MAKHWQEVQIRAVESPTTGNIKAGESLKIFATVALGTIPPEHVRVELYFGPLDSSGSIRDARVHGMAASTTLGDGVYQYVGAINAAACGQQGFAVRVLPNHPNINLRFEPGLIRWS